MAQSKIDVTKLSQPFQDFINSGGKGLFDCTHMHPGQTCWQYDYWKIKNVLIASLKVFFFANILPALIFRFKNFKKKPKEEIMKTLKSYFRSVAFLTLACALPPTVNCHLMKLMGYTGRLPGFLS